MNDKEPTLEEAWQQRQASRKISGEGCTVFSVGSAWLTLSILLTLRFWIMDNSPANTNNLGLLADRIVGAIVSVGWTIASLLLILFSAYGRNKSRN